MKINTFRSRIIITVIIVVSLFSSSAFYLYSNYLSKRIYKNTEENTIAVLDLINEPARITYRSHNSQSFRTLINEIKKKNQVSNAYFFDSSGIQNFHQNFYKFNDGSPLSSEVPLLREDVTFKTFKSNKKTYSRAFIRLQNAKDCYSCHSYTTENLGYVVFDFSINQTQKNINFTRKFSIAFTVFMVIILGGFVLLMHYRFVRGSLLKFQKSINVINHGNLSERVSISNAKELGELAKCFNKMMDNFEETRNQLNSYHEREMLDAQKLATIGEMSARLAHEIRNPIMGIANAIEIIVDDTEDEQNKPILQEIKRQANRVNEAISKLLKYSKSETLNLEKQNINENVKSIVFFLKNQSSTNNITFVLELQSKIPDFYFDKEMIENAFFNLSLNAIDAIEEKHTKGILTYRTSFNSIENLVTVTIEDNGIGIPSNIIKDIFKPFYTTKTEGTGLGMAIIKDTIEKHKGKITVESEPGVGSVFTLTFPVGELRSLSNKIK